MLCVINALNRITLIQLVKIAECTDPQTIPHRGITVCCYVWESLLGLCGFLYIECGAYISIS